MSLFVFGMGYSARAAAAALQQHDNGPVGGTSRTPQGAARIRGLGYRGHVFDGETPGSGLEVDLGQARHLLISIAPDAEGDPVLRLHRRDLEAAQSLRWICYYSSIAVYGDRDGGWVDETGATDAVSARARRRIRAEQAWRDFASARDVGLCILRLGGIYGPGRSIFDRLANGTAHRIVKPGQVFNRIHVGDIARITAAAARHRLEGVYNVTDDEPAPPQDLVTFAAELAGRAPPPQLSYEQAELTPMQQAFYADNKRVSNQAIKKALNLELLYPSYRDGLCAIYETLK